MSPQIIITLICLLNAGAALAGPAGFEKITIPVSGTESFEAAFWYPSAGPTRLMDVDLTEQDVSPMGKIVGSDLPLIVMAPGSLGAWYSNIGTALALARAGFVVADMTLDKPANDGVLRTIPRPRRLSALIDFALHDWHYHTSINPAKIGAFGFSLGAFTDLIAAGGKPDLALIAPHCRANPAEWSCTMQAGHHLDIAFNPPPDVEWPHDLRIRAMVLAAPALGYLFGNGGLRKVGIPVQLWRAEHDTVLSEPSNAEAIRSNLPNPPDDHVASGADHGDFTSPCRPKLEAMKFPLCFVNPDPKFNRRAFQTGFESAVVAFFETHVAQSTK